MQTEQDGNGATVSLHKTIGMGKQVNIYFTCSIIQSAKRELHVNEKGTKWIQKGETNEEE